VRSLRAIVTMSPEGARFVVRLCAMTDSNLTMRAWRTHEYGRPTEVLRLDTVPIPEPDAGKLRVKVQAIPFNLNDLERITGGNMMVRPELPYSPGMEVMGVVEAAGDDAGNGAGARGGES